MQILALRALRDNYVFGFFDSPRRRAAVVDPGESAPVFAWLRDGGLELESILVTHHHHDHTGGISDLKAAFPHVRVLGNGLDSRIPGLTEAVRPGDVVTVCGRPARIIDLAAHTRQHIAFHFFETGDLFSGDTLFAGTCGNVFEGTAADMMRALERIRALPDETRVWCAHEYTLYFLPDAARIEPWNEGLIAPRVERMRRKLESEGQTVPLLLGEEKATNPFLHWDSAETCERLGTPPGLATFERIVAISG